MSKQHTKPCKDCPWRKVSAPGWLGGFSVQYWLSAAHSDVVIQCHTNDLHQCAGMAMYRSNVCKSVRAPMLDLPSSPLAFSNPFDFSKHHGVKTAPQILPFGMTEETANAIDGKRRTKRPDGNSYD